MPLYFTFVEAESALDLAALVDLAMTDMSIKVHFAIKLQNLARLRKDVQEEIGEKLAKGTQRENQ